MEVIINIQQIAKNLMYRIIPFYTFWYIVMQTHEIKFILFKRKKNVYFELRSRLLQWQYHVSFKSWKDRRWMKNGLQI